MSETAMITFSVSESFSEIIVVTMASYCRFISLCLPLLIIVLKVNSAEGQSVGSQYRGLYIGPITSRKHKVSGEVYAVDSRTLHIRNFNYDGTGPDAFFWTGFTDNPSTQGIIIPNDHGTKEVLKGYTNQDVTISLPDGLTLRDIKWFAVWCRAYEVNFGDLYIPQNLDFPQPHVIGSLVSQNGVSSGPIVVVDAQTILVPDFTYDGQAPDLHFWVGRGTPGPQGIRVPDETGSDAPLQKADKKTMVLSLPGDLTIFDIDYFGVWCRLYSIDFGHVRITPSLNVPPSLRMLGVAPQSKLNCEVLNEDRAFEIRWSVVESGETIVFQLVGRIDDGNYMAFGLSGEDDRSVMVGGDAMIGWFDQTSGRGNVVDYYLGSKSVCKGDYGSCPDVKLKDGVNNVRLLSAAAVNGFTIITFQRKLKALDHFDKQIKTNGSQPVIWAVGTMQNDIAGYHSIRSKDDFSIDFGRTPKWNCPEPEPEPEFNENSPSQATILSTSPNPDVEKSPTAVDPVQAASDHGASYLNPLAWKIPPVPCHEPEDRIFYAQIGPSGRKEVFRSITGRDEKPVNVWYINGLLMPEIYLIRNMNYTFVVQGGDDSLYITSDSVGDFEHKSIGERQSTNIYAGVGTDSRGNSIATAGGKSCRWVESPDQPADTFTSYAAYQRSLSLDCKKGHSGVLQFTPDETTPNTVYYQSYSKGHLGWKIHILDKCESKEKLSNELRPSLDKGSSSPAVAVMTSQNLHHQPDQNVGESINRESVLAFAYPHGTQNINLRDVPHQQPIGSGHPVENAYVIDTSTGGGKIPFPNALPPLDNTRLIYNGKPIESVTQGPSLNTRQGQILAGPPGGTFQFPQNGALYQIAIDSGGEDGGRSGPQNVYAPSGFQVPMSGDGHLLRRNGVPQLQVASPFKIAKYGDRPEAIYDSKPEYYIGNNRQPLMSHQIRYDGGPAQSVIYATTSSPQQRLNSPMSYISHYDKQPEYSEISMRMPGPGQIVRVQNIPRRHPSDISVMGGNPDSAMNVKYIEYPHSAIQIIQNDGRGSPPKTWTHQRNLPKRDHSRQELPVFFDREFIRGALKSIRRDSRNDDSHQSMQMTRSQDSRLSQIQSRMESPEMRLNSPPNPTIGERVDRDINRDSSESSLLTSSENPENVASQPKVQNHESQQKKCGGTEANSRACGTESPVVPLGDKITEEEKRTNQSVQQSQKKVLYLASGCNKLSKKGGSMDKNNLLESEEATQPVPDPVFESFGPVFRPSPPDTDGFNVSKDFGQQSYHQSYLIPEQTSKPEFPRMLSKPRLTSPFIPFLKRSPSNRNEYWLPDFPTHARIPQRLLANRPGSSSSTFHEIIKLLVPGSRNNALKYDIKSHLQTANGPVSPIRRFPSRQPFIQARNEVVVTLPRVPPLPQAPVINNNKAQINKEGQIGRNDESALGGNGGESSSGGANGGKEGQDNLSLTLLTDVWQIINHQGISKPSQPPNLQQEQQQNQPIGKPGRQFPATPVMMIKSHGNPGVISNFPYRHQRQPFYSRGLGGNTKEDKGKQGRETSPGQTSVQKTQEKESLAGK